MTPTNEPSTEGRIRQWFEEHRIGWATPEEDERQTFIKADEWDAEITELREQLNRVIESSSIAESARLNAEAEAKRLREALEAYGEHDLSCQDQPRSRVKDWECICGLETALAQSILKDAPSTTETKPTEVEAHGGQ